MAFQKTPDFRYIPPAAKEQKKSRPRQAAGQAALSLILPVPHSGGKGGKSFGVTFNNPLQPGQRAEVQLPEGQQAATQVISEQQFHGNQHDDFFGASPSEGYLLNLFRAWIPIRFCVSEAAWYTSSKYSAGGSGFLAFTRH